MLVLSRRLNETIVIGDDIEIAIVHINGQRIGLGIKAPPGISVHRKEVWELIHEQKRGEGR
jgi:carbon storage regulator